MNYMSRVQILTLAVLLIGVLGISAMGVAVVLGAQQSAPVVTLAPVVKLAVALPSETAWTVPTLPKLRNHKSLCAPSESKEATVFDA